MQQRGTDGQGGVIRRVRLAVAVEDTSRSAGRQARRSPCQVPKNPSPRERIEPAQAGEAGEIAVR